MNQTPNRDAQRAELHRTIWKVADEMRGSVVCFTGLLGD